MKAREIELELRAALGLPGSGRSESQDRMRAVTPTTTMMPPSPTWEPEECTGLRPLSWREASGRLAQAVESAPTDVEGVRVVARLAGALAAVSDAAPRCPLPGPVAELYGVANEALSLLLDDQAEKSVAFWLLGERLALAPRLDPTLDFDGSVPDAPTLAAALRDVADAVASLRRLVRTLAAPQSKEPPMADLGRYMPTPESLRETTLPPSRERPTTRRG